MTKDTSLSDMVAALIASNKGKKTKKAKKPIDPTKPVHLRTEFKGRRLARMNDGTWAEEHRVLLIREVECTGCGLIQSAPNDILMVRKMSPKHGMIEEGIGFHGAQYLHLPIKMETHRSQIHICQHCIHKQEENDHSHSAQLLLDLEPIIHLIPKEPTHASEDGISILDTDSDDKSDLFALFPSTGES